MAYRLRFAYAFAHSTDALLMPPQKALVAKVGPGQGAPLGVANALVWQSEADLMFEERLSLLVRLLNAAAERG